MKSHFSINKILVPIDLTPVSSKLIANAGQLAKKAQAKLHFLTVIEPPTPVFVEGSVAAPMTAEFIEVQRKAAVLKLKKLVQSVKVPYQTEITVGHPATEINRIALEKKADLIYLTGHDAGALEHFFGSVSESVALSSRSPVWLLRQPKSTRKILLPLDGSKASLEALGPACYLAELYRAKIQPVSIVQEYFVPSAAFLTSRQGLGSQKEWLRERTQVLEHQIPSQPLGMFLPPIIRFGEPKAELSKIIAQLKPDLVVMASHRKKMLNSLILGRTSSRLLRQTKASFLLIHPND